MKTFTKIFMAVVALFAFACTTDTTFDQTVELGAGQTTITLSLDEESRTHITGKNGDEYPLYWSEGDKIAVNGKTSNALGEASHGQTTATFTVEGEQARPWNIVYPAPAEGVTAEKAGNYPVTFMASQPYTANTFAEGSTPMYAYVNENASVNLQHLAGVLRFDVKGNGEVLKALVVEVKNGKISGNFDVNCATGEVTPHADATNTVTVTFPENGLTLSTTATPIYVAVPAGDYGKVTLTLYANDGKIMKGLFDSSAKAIAPGVVREFPEFVLSDYSQVEEGVFYIYDEASLRTFANSINDTDTEKVAAFNTAYPNAKVVANIELTEPWTSINGYTGTFDGGNYSISNLDAPLFGTTQAAAIKNVHLKKVNITKKLTDGLYVGALVSEINASSAVVVENCSARGKMDLTLNLNNTTARAIGGIIGRTTAPLTLSDLVSNIDITTNRTDKNETTLNLGGVVGQIETNVVTGKELTNNGKISVTGTFNKNLDVGGVIGYHYKGVSLEGAITNNGEISINDASIKENLILGGVVGWQRSIISNDSSSTITNNAAINVSSVEIKDDKLCFGGIIGISQGKATLHNLHNTSNGTITFDSITSKTWFNFGGIVCYFSAAGSSINNAKNEGNITITNCTYSGSKCMDIGGILGTVTEDATLSGEIINTGNITVYSSKNTNVSGMVGIAGIMGVYYTDTVTMTNATLKNSGTIKCIGGEYATTTYFGVGGIFGYFAKNLENATNTGTVIGATNSAICSVGGLVGTSAGTSVKDSKCFGHVAAFDWTATEGATLTKSANVGMITGGAYTADVVENCHVGGWIGESATVVNNKDGKLDVEVSYTQLYKNTYVNYLYNEPIAVAVATGDICGYLSSETASPDFAMDETTATLIGTADQLVAWAASAANSTKHAMLTDDIDMTKKEWASIEGFNKIFDGNNHKIIGLSAPLFGTTNAAAIKNLTLTNVAINITVSGTQEKNIGVLACKVDNADAVIENCSASGTLNVTGDSPSKTIRVGGLIACAATTVEIKDLVNEVDITIDGSFDGTALIAGCVGDSDSKNPVLKNCKNLGNITGNATFNGNHYVSGVAGLTGDLIDCENGLEGYQDTYGKITITGTTKTNFFVGGISSHKGKTRELIDNCINYGNIVIGGKREGTRYYMNIGGISANGNATSIENCDNYGDITCSIQSSHNQIHMLAGVTCQNSDSDLVSVKKCTNYGKIEITENASFTNSSSTVNIIGTVRFSHDLTNAEDLSNEGDITINGTYGCALNVGGISNMIVSDVTCSGEFSNSGKITIGAACSGVASVGGLFGKHDSNTVTWSEGTKLSNSGEGIVVNGKFKDVAVGGVFGRLAKDTSVNATNIATIEYSGTKHTDVADSDYSVYVGGIAGTMSSLLSGARCHCTVTAWGYANVGMVTGSAYAETTKATNCHIGGTIDQGAYGEYTNDDNIEVNGWHSKPLPIRADVYYKAIYSNRDIEATTAVTDGCGYISAIDAAPVYAEVE